MSEPISKTEQRSFIFYVKGHVIPYKLTQTSSHTSAAINLDPLIYLCETLTKYDKEFLPRYEEDSDNIPTCCNQESCSDSSNDTDQSLGQNSETGLFLDSDVSNHSN